MEEPRVTIEYTSTVRVCISDIVSHLRRVDVEPGPVINEILDQFESKIRQFPLSCQISPELLKIGCGKYRNIILREDIESSIQSKIIWLPSTLFLLTDKIFSNYYLSA
ncbi:hypothetical protein GMX10_18175 [Pectobacterium parvum]|uniref:Uncharacterized protein n=1 Tax=Pectobacterium parvum TaxID=2778550 RepID=A0AAP9IIL3_9GAMM|nr:hypothetical protein GMX10_18175 [Pectobacterium parvum]